MPRPSSITMALPPFAGSTRQLIIVNLFAFFGFALFGWVAPGPVGLLLGHLALVPAAVAAVAAKPVMQLGKQKNQLKGGFAVEQ